MSVVGKGLRAVLGAALVALSAWALWRLPVVRNELLTWGPWLILVPLAAALGWRLARRQTPARWLWLAHLGTLGVLLAVAHQARPLLEPLARRVQPPAVQVLADLAPGLQAPGLLAPAIPFAVRSKTAEAWLDALLYGLCAALGHVQAQAVRARQRERERERALADLTQARLQALQLQLNPHFLFNALNAVAGLIHQDPRAADAMLADLAELLRASLDRADQAEVSLAQELKLLEAYLAIERRRHGGRLTVTVEAPPQTQAARVPTLLLQPLVENAVRHGVGAHSGPGWVRVHARTDGDRLVVDIRDSGPGPTRDATLGVGLSNTRARLAHLYGDRQRVAWIFEGGVACLRIELPLHYEETEWS